MARDDRGARTGLRFAWLCGGTLDEPPGPPGPSMTDPDIATLLHAAEPTDAAPLGPLIERLEGSGLLRGARRDGRPIGAAGLADIAVRGVTLDSRRIQAGSVFAAIAGLHVDGH